MDLTDESSDTPTNGIDDTLKRRMSKITTQRRDALAQVAELEAAKTALEKRLASADALGARVADLEAQISHQATQHHRGMSLVNAGVHDAEAREFLLHRYTSAGADAPEFSEWLATQRENATGFLSGVFGNTSPAPEATTPAEPPAATAATPSRPAPAINSGTRATPTGPDGLSVDAILDPNRSFADIKAALGLSLDPRSRKG